MATDTNLNQLVINKLTKAQYQEAKETNSIVETEIYMITDEEAINADTLGGHPASDFAPAGDYATESFVTNKISEAQLSGGGDIDLSGYATKDELNALTASDVGAAESSHNHAASNITSGTLGVARGGTGRATLTANAVLAGNTTSAVKQIATASGALYATAANGAAQFGTLPIAQGGTGATDRLAAAKNLTNESVSSPGYVVSLTGSWANFGYTTLAQLRTAMGVASETPSITSMSNTYHYAHFAKIGKLVICTILPKITATNNLISSATITNIASAYRPSANKTFTFFSEQAKSGGDTSGKATITIGTNGTMTFGATYQATVHEFSRTIFWMTA